MFEDNITFETLKEKTISFPRGYEKENEETIENWSFFMSKFSNWFDEGAYDFGAIIVSEAEDRYSEGYGNKTNSLRFYGSCSDESESIYLTIAPYDESIKPIKIRFSNHHANTYNTDKYFYLSNYSNLYEVVDEIIDCIVDYMKDIYGEF